MDSELEMGLLVNVNVLPMRSNGRTAFREGHRRLEEARHVLDQRRDAAALPAQTDAEARSTLSVDLNAETDSKGPLNAASPLESMSSEACVS
jgi:hypothetical protein